MNKKSLRIWAKNKRKELNMNELSSVLTEALSKTEEYKSAKNIMLFYPLKDEVNLLSLLNDSSKNFYLPRIKGKELECCIFKEGDELCESCFHILEPTCKACDMSVIDLIIIPALLCDKEKYRLGYGGGYYDRLLEKCEDIKKIVCIPSALIVDSICPEKYDIKADCIITELFSI